MDRTDIVNATKPLTILVPEQLTHSKRRKNSYHCVFAEACHRMPHVEEAIVHLSTAYLRFKGEQVFKRYRVNMRLRDQIVMFDRFGAFDPGEYTLSLIQPSHRASGRRQGTSPTGAKPGQQRKRVFIKGVRAPANIATL
jgi:hypothetical protein